MATTIHSVQVEKSSGDLAREQQLAWKLAELATRAKDAPQDADAVAMAKNRIIDNAATRSLPGEPARRPSGA
jgi:2-methylcitrate dehydratase